MPDTRIAYKNQLRLEYDRIYGLADELFKKFKPCKHDCKGRCEDYRCSTGKIINCCDGCEYLRPDGCKVKALGCKLWYCGYIRNQYPKLVEYLNKLKMETQRVGIVVGVRADYNYTEENYLGWFITRQKELKNEE